MGASPCYDLGICIHCGEPLDDLNLTSTLPFGRGISGAHRLCALRMIVGSVAHQQGRCECPGSTGEVKDDPPEGMTIRQAARLAALYWSTRDDVSRQDKAAWHLGDTQLDLDRIESEDGHESTTD